MSFNPFNEKPEKLDKLFIDWSSMYVKSYNKDEVDPYTKVRSILMNGTEFEATWFLHQFHRHCADNDLRRELALIRRQEQQQQKLIACLKPIDETVLETTISYEQVAVDLTAILAQREPNEYVKQALDFALLEDFDHLYRYADLLEYEHGVHAERLVGSYTEIMPGRPTVSEHRYPFDDVRRYTDFKTAEPLTKLNIAIITAAEQQTMNYYMNQAGFYTSDLGRRLYQEIGMIEEQHVTHYGSLMDPNVSWLECMLNHEYTECYLYYSCWKDETDPSIRTIWERLLTMEIAHLHRAAELLKKIEGREWQEVIPNPEFPELLTFEPQKEYVRSILKNTVTNTSTLEDYCDINAIDDDAKFFMYQETIEKNVKLVPSHNVINSYIDYNGKDYRFEEKPHPVESLKDRTKDNTDLGRKKCK